MEDLEEILTPLLENTEVPSLAAAVVVGSETRAAGAVGVRKRGYNQGLIGKVCAARGANCIKSENHPPSQYRA